MIQYSELMAVSPTGAETWDSIPPKSVKTFSFDLARVNANCGKEVTWMLCDMTVDAPPALYGLVLNLKDMPVGMLNTEVLSFVNDNDNTFCVPMSFHKWMNSGSESAQLVVLFGTPVTLDFLGVGDDSGNGFVFGGAIKLFDDWFKTIYPNLYKYYVPDYTLRGQRIMFPITFGHDRIYCGN